MAQSLIIFFNQVMSECALLGGDGEWATVILSGQEWMTAASLERLDPGE